MTFSVTGPSKHCSTEVTTCSSCDPCPSISSKSVQASSCTATVSGSLPRIYSRWYGLATKLRIVPVTFSSSRLLKAISTALELSILIALPPGVVLLVLLVLGPLQGAHRSVHFGY
jgi:hypothetical protein